LASAGMKNYVMPDGDGPAHIRLKAHIEKLVGEGGFAEAFEHFEKAVRLSLFTPPSVDCLLKLADAYADVRDYHGAIDTLEIVIKHYPESSERDIAELKLGLMLNHVGYVKKAREHYAMALKSEQQDLREMAQEAIDETTARLTSRICSAPEDVNAPDKWSVVKSIDDECDLIKAGEIISEITRLPRLDVARNLRVSSGFLCSAIPLETAMTLSNKLQEIELPVLIFRDDAGVPLPPAEMLNHIQMENGQLILRYTPCSVKGAAPREKVCSLDASQVFYIVAGLTSSERETDLLPESCTS
jgi:tetratricopeptide (TPR) repeat protein